MQDRTTRDESVVHRIEPQHDMYPDNPPIAVYSKLDEMKVPLQLRCDGCGEESVAHMRFCKHCGLRLSSNDALPMSEPNLPETAFESGCLVCLQANGSDGAIMPLDKEQADIGRMEGDIVFTDDPYLSARHARIQKRADGYYLVDLQSVNGVYVRLTEPASLQHGDTVLIGQQVLRLELLPEAQPLGTAFQQGVKVFGTPEVPRPARLVQYTTEGVGRDTYTIYRDETVLGRESGDIVFTDDPFLSRRHAAILRDRVTGAFSLHDLGSSNGTGLRIRLEHKLRPGDQIRMGRQLFRFEVDASHSGERLG
jgi:pSer/pThr/pTyr-binding forkhead associated (FHA) protein